MITPRASLIKAKEEKKPAEPAAPAPAPAEEKPQK